jgi:hypothetical protein
MAMMEHVDGPGSQVALRAGSTSCGGHCTGGAAVAGGACTCQFLAEAMTMMEDVD